MISLTFFIFLANSLDFGLQPQNAVVNQNGILLMGTESASFFSTSGEFNCKIKFSSNNTAFPLKKYLILQDFDEFHLKVFRHDGELVKIFPNSNWAYIKEINNEQILIVPAILDPGYQEHWEGKTNKKIKNGTRFGSFSPGKTPYPNMIELFSIKQVNNTLDFIPEKKFFRSTPEQKHFNFSFNNMFLVSHDGLYYIMTEINNNIYVYSDKTIHEERTTDSREFFKKPSINLNLVDFISPTPHSEHLKSIYFDRKEWFRDIRSYFNSFSKIKSFSKTEFGFQIIYSVPSKPEGGLKHLEIKIYVQEVDQYGNNRGQVRKFENLKGSFAGASGKNFYWLQKEPGQKTGILQVHHVD